MAFPPSAQAPAPAAAPDAPDDGANEAPSVLVTANGDGTYTLTDGDASQDASEPATPGDPEQKPVTVQSIQDACKALVQMLGGATDPKAAWAAEAGKRGASGMPTQPSMSM